MSGSTLRYVRWLGLAALAICVWSLIGLGCGGTGDHLVGTTQSGNSPPIAAFTVSPTTGTTETLFQFDASSSSDDQTPSASLRVRWDWQNDGRYDTLFSATNTATHRYASLGTKTVKLQVTDDGRGGGGGGGHGCQVPKGLSSTVLKTVTVTANSAPVISSLTADPDNVAPGAASNVTCNATDEDRDPLTCTWTASGGTVTGSGASVTWSAAAAGTYTITCTVSDGDLDDSLGVQVTVTSTEIIIN